MKKAITFYFDEESGEMIKTKIHNDFEKADSLMKADVLNDCLGYIENLYSKYNDKYFSALEQRYIQEKNK
tara:strand:- start:174 stop:383 length:210 start_codon:yes stop_codon:yes gene_type:complete